MGGNASDCLLPPALMMVMYGKDSAMLENLFSHPGTSTLSEVRQVKAMLRLVEDLGYDVQVASDGDWTVVARNEPVDRTVVGVDTAREVAAAARQLAESLLVDRAAAPLSVG
jgi:hypothetical protein